jgi:photosystem II stability/assembly factor-like uncharacterized protein
MKKTTLVVASTALALASFAQATHPTWAEKNAHLSASPKKGLLELVAKDQYSIWGLSYPVGDILGSNDEFVRSTDGGNTWKMIPSPYPGFFVNGAAAVDSLTAYFAITDYQGNDSNDNHIVKTIDGGQNWTEVLSPPGTTVPTHVYFFNANEGIVICDPTDDYWTIYRTADGGQSWTRIGQDSVLNAPHEGEGAATFIFDAEGDYYWFLTYTGTGEASRVFYSPDRGNIWLAGSTLPVTETINTAAISFRDTNIGLLRINDKLLKTSNHGSSWTPVTTSGTMFTFDMCHVPGTQMFISTGGDTSSAAHSRSGIGTSYTVDDGATWVTIDTAVHHTAIVFTSAINGWTGGITNDNDEGGAFKAEFPTTGIAKQPGSKGEAVSVYPNPASAMLTVTVAHSSGNDLRDYAITDLSGRTIASGVLTREGQADVSGLGSGMYFLHLNGSPASAVRFIRQ